MWWLWVPLGALVLIAVAWLAWYGVALWQLNRIKEEISAAGFPSAVAEVIPENIPDSQNAADLLLRVQEIWNKVKDSKGFIKASAGEKDAERDPLLFDAAKLEQLQAQMQRPDMQELFRLMGEAAWMPVAHFDRDYSKGAMIELGPIASMLAGAQQVTAKAWLAARQGKQKVAADDLLTLSRLASFGLRDVLLIGWLVGVAIDQLSVGSAQLVLGALPAGSFKMEEWKPLDELWAVHAKEARGDLVRVLEAERLISAHKPPGT